MFAVIRATDDKEIEKSKRERGACFAVRAYPSRVGIVCQSGVLNTGHNFNVFLL